MSAFIDSMLARAEADRQTIVLPEGDDERTLAAAEKVLALGCANLIILGNAAAIRKSGYQLEGAQILDVAEAEVKQELARGFYELRRHKGVTERDAQEKMDDPIYFGTMMVKLGMADGQVCGACHSTSDVLRAALQILKTAPGVKSVSSFFVEVVPDCEFGDEGVFMFADCGLEIQPDVEKLSQIAVSTGRSWQTIFGTEPRIALLSHSTYRSAGAKSDPDRDKVIEATAVARQIAPDLLIDGELQADAALVPSVAASKAPNSPVAGRANVLVFPDLDTGNIAYKLVQRLAKAEAYGPITQGLAAPMNDLSRGCSADDIVGVIAITCVQSQARKAQQ